MILKSSESFQSDQFHCYQEGGHRNTNKLQTREARWSWRGVKIQRDAGVSSNRNYIIISFSNSFSLSLSLPLSLSLSLSYFY